MSIKIFHPSLALDIHFFNVNKLIQVLFHLAPYDLIYIFKNEDRRITDG